jgi:hypothetical protein
MYESDFDELMLIKSENESLMAGEQVIAEATDTHADHIREHRAVMNDPDLRKNPVLRKLVQDHMQEHIDLLKTVSPDLLQILGQQPIQAPPPAPGQGNPADMMQPPGGIPQPGDMLTGQGTAGGQMIPQPASPPAGFENLATNAQDLLPQS